jgi:hypothetical protein
LRTLKLVGVAVVAACMGLVAMPAYAASTPAVTGPIVIQSQACANVCFQLTVDNPTAGTITLRLTGHTPGGGDEWVDVGAPHVPVTIVAGQTSYQGCFGDVSQFIANKGFNSLRIDIVSWSFPELEGNTTKSGSFTCTGGSSPTPTPSGGVGGGGGGTALASTGGFNYPILLIGLSILAGGLVLLFVTAGKRMRQS